MRQRESGERIPHSLGKTAILVFVAVRWLELAFGFAKTAAFQHSVRGWQPNSM
jgi:hypothetical protein